jgi:hypothetical protein
MRGNLGFTTSVMQLSLGLQHCRDLLSEFLQFHFKSPRFLGKCLKLPFQENLVLSWQNLRAQENPGWALRPRSASQSWTK